MFPKVLRLIGEGGERVDDLESIYKAYFEDVRRYALRLSRDEKKAEELTSDVFFRAMNSLHRFRGDCSIYTWLCQIAKNLWLDRLRSEKRFSEKELPETLPDETDFEQQLADTDTAWRLHRILHTLPEPYKEVFSLRVFGELSFKRIGLLFGKSENWACVTFHRAKSKVQEQWEESK